MASALKTPKATTRATSLESSTGGSESSSEPSESASELSKLHFNGADDRGLVATVEHVYEDGQLIESNA